jgi:hypothetical protein
MADMLARFEPRTLVQFTDLPVADAAPAARATIAGDLEIAEAGWA